MAKKDDLALARSDRAWTGQAGGEPRDLPLETRSLERPVTGEVRVCT